MDDKGLTITSGQPESVIPSGPQRGAFADSDGVNFSIASKNATKVELCLFDDTGEHELQRVALPGHTGNVFHGHIAGLKAGQVYGYRVYGSYDPTHGHLFNPAKLVLDPAARDIVGKFEYDDINCSASPDDATQPDPRDNAAYTVKARIPQPLPLPDAAEKVSFPRKDDIVYEFNVRSLTMLLPRGPGNAETRTANSSDSQTYNVKLPDEAASSGSWTHNANSPLPFLPDGILPGTGDALTADPVTAHLKRHGNTLEMMPVSAGLSERRLVKLGLNNLWNYNALNWFTPDPRLFPGGAAEVRNVVKQLHKSGFKVVFDFAFNHTSEIDERGTRGYTTSLRGIDNSTYYRLRDDDKRVYENWTGCGNTINIDEPETQRLILDVLRYWIKEIGADGIRFDLAAILGRRKNGDFDREHPFFKALMADPIISKAELFLEPWDARWSLEDMPPLQRGNQLGNMPDNLPEWNGRYRDEVREFWRGDDSMMARMAARLTGSCDIFGHKSGTPHVSTNAITFHDGFTMRDLVTYNEKHNRANEEDNLDGERNNRSRNHGVEGPTDDPAINAARLQDMRNMRATLFLSQGTPLVLQGDEVGNTQHGNNNAYCQDNETGWVKWDDSPEARQLEDFSAYVKSLRDEFPMLRQDEFLHGNKTDAYGVQDISWFSPSGPQQDSDWNNPWARCFGMMLNGGAMPPASPDAPQDKRRLCTIFNASAGTVDFKLPQLAGGATWTRILDTAEPELRRDTDKTAYEAGKAFGVKGNSLALFVQNPAP